MDAGGLRVAGALSGWMWMRSSECGHSRGIASWPRPQVGSLPCASAEPRLEWIEVTIDCIHVERVAEFRHALPRSVHLDDPLPGSARLSPTESGEPVLNTQPVPEAKWPTPKATNSALSVRQG